MRWRNRLRTTWRLLDSVTQDDGAIAAWNWSGPNGSTVATTPTFSRTFAAPTTVNMTLMAPTTVNMTLMVTNGGGLTNSVTDRVVSTGNGGPTDSEVRTVVVSRSLQGEFAEPAGIHSGSSFVYRLKRNRPGRFRAPTPCACVARWCSSPSLDAAITRTCRTRHRTARDPCWENRKRHPR